MRREFGSFLKFRVFGASHAPAVKFTLSNFPAGFRVDLEKLGLFMSRRAPGRDVLSTARRETDDVNFASGFVNGISDGSTIEGKIDNNDVRPHDYGVERTIPRPGHADFGQWIEQGRIPTGGGSNSGRMTAAICAAGGICKQWLESRGVMIGAHPIEIGGKRESFGEVIEAAKREGDSVGGIVACEIVGLQAGIGGALFDGIESELSAALFGIPGVKGVEFGNGFAAARLRGSENNDPFVMVGGQVKTDGNRHGGVLGGRTTGMPLAFKVAFKPTPTIFKVQRSVDLGKMSAAEISMKGRHDPCIVLRAVPVVEATAALVLADVMLSRERDCPRICLTLTGRTLAEDIAQFESQRYFTDIVELRADLLKREELSRISSFPSMVPVPVILTIRRKRDGGEWNDADEATRTEVFRQALSDNSNVKFAYVDFEDDYRIPELTDLANVSGIKIIRSVHCFSGAIKDVVRKCRELRGQTCEIPKIAFQPAGILDVAELLRESSTFTEIPHILCAMGRIGLPSRVLSSRTHSMLTYASVSGLESIGHITPQQLVRDYRIRMLDSESKLFGVTGWPLKTTRSPEINNAAFSTTEENAVMFPLASDDIGNVLEFMRIVGMKGMAVTIPHKQTVMPLLDVISDEAREVGAVNTIVNESGKLVGYNTDVYGFSRAICDFVGAEKLNGYRVAVLGNGGAAKAVVYALERLGAKPEVFHRRQLLPGFKLIVNATPVDPIPDYEFSGDELVYDLGYVPEVTQLMQRASKAGCRVENGLSMLKAQALGQRRLWFGKLMI